MREVGLRWYTCACVVYAGACVRAYVRPVREWPRWGLLHRKVLSIYIYIYIYYYYLLLLKGEDLIVYR